MTDSSKELPEKVRDALYWVCERAYAPGKPGEAMQALRAAIAEAIREATEQIPEACPYCGDSTFHGHTP